jgi:phosphatidylglycerol:prolipoprotein diacylglycerol transferase
VFPYIEHPTWSVGPFSVQAFFVLVCAAVLVGFEVAVRHAPRAGFDHGTVAVLVAWTLAGGFVGSHLFEMLAYDPGRVAREPLSLLAIWGAMSSFGGMLGGVLGGLAAMKWRGMSAAEMLRFTDLLAFAFPFAWCFGRAGCALAHDHLGPPSDHWLAVRFPDGPRLDLGLLELLLTIAIAGLFAWLGRRHRPPGFFLGLFFALYGPARFGLDALRVFDARYLGWTPAQYLALASTAMGLCILFRLRGAAARRFDPKRRAAQ